MDLMAARGAEVTPEEMQIIEEYLSHRTSPRPQTGSAATQQESAPTHSIEDHP